ncbi:MAG TPA: hypothetical protein VN844_07580 [Pyrinomonadaceae bacterium]|nr:hypothetical protein [Pyrinomonadaceae bacterium]
MRIQRTVRSVSRFVGQVGVALVKAVLTSVMIGAFAVGLMHYMGVPVPNPHDLINGITKLAESLS